MECNNCMNYRPSKPHNGEFTCPECGQKYVLAGVWPGDYYETYEQHEEELKETEKLLNEYRNARTKKELQQKYTL